jgi:hypothetical protein
MDKIMKSSFVPLAIATILLTAPARSEDITQEPGLSDWLTLSANVDGGHRKTQFFADDHNSTVLQWDSRLEGWLPPGRRIFSWGPYLRLAGIEGGSSEPWENAWLAVPGIGLQVYPFSARGFRNTAQPPLSWLGPLRLFAEYNRMDYGGGEHAWRPDEQIRAGLDYWKAWNVNRSDAPLWSEIWCGLTWQSANEFDDSYDTVILGNTVRLGARIPNAGPLSMITPYIAAESTLTGNDEYYWENRLLLGGGLRLAPDLRRLPSEWKWLGRVVVYAEYLNAATYYGDSAPDDVPEHDVRIGLSVSLGHWYMGQ